MSGNWCGWSISCPGCVGTINDEVGAMTISSYYAGGKSKPE